MKTVVKAVVVAIFIFAAVNVSAQPSHRGKGGHHNVEQIINKMKTELSLTDDQVAKIKALGQETMQKMRAEGADKMAIMKERTAKMKTILTPEQSAKWEEYMKKAAQDHKAKMDKSSHDSEHMLAKMKEKLALTDDQVAKIKVLNQETIQKMNAEKADRTAVMKEKATKLRAILTPEQNKKWDEYMRKAEEARKMKKEAPVQSK